MDTEYLKFQITKIRQALEILKKNRQNLMVAMDITSPINPNESGRLNRIITEYVVIKVTALIDKDKRTFSLFNLNNKNLTSILKKYNDMLMVIKKNRDKAFGHHEKNFIVNEDIMQAADLFDLPLLDFLKEIEKEL